MSLSDCCLKFTSYKSKKQRASFSHDTLVVGYYNRGNTGDEMFKLAFEDIFHGRRLYFVSIYDLRENDITQNTSTIIVGGGDVINEAFMEILLKSIKHFRGRIYAFSVGIHEDTGLKYLHVFDHVFVRNNTDFQSCKTTIGSKNTTLMEDACFLMSHRRLRKLADDELGGGGFRIGVILSRQAINDDNNKPLDRLARAINNAKFPDLAVIHIVPFNTHVQSQRECDIGTCLELKSLLTREAICYHGVKNARDAASIVVNMNMNICMRYSAAMFSKASLGESRTVLYCVTPKMIKLSWDSCCPTIHATSSSKSMSKVLSKASFSYMSPYASTSSSAPMNFDILKEKRIMVKPLFVPRSYCEIRLHFDSIARDPHTICHLLAGDVNSHHFPSLSKRMMERGDAFNCEEAMKQIWNDVQLKVAGVEFAPEQYHYAPSPVSENRIYIDFDERISDWPLVIDGLMHMHAYRRFRHPDIYVDLYIDRTFHWGCNTYRRINRIPYLQDWIGILHHTFDTSHEYNSTALFHNSDFIMSLSTCVCIVVFTEYLAVRLRANLDALSMFKVVVKVLNHPTDMGDERKDWHWCEEKFFHNAHRCLLQIGSWMIDKDAIYEIDLGINNLSLNRAVIETEFVCGLESLNLKSFMTCNIVFLKLIDCSACIAVIECIMRETPVIVNRHVALEEILGKDYPGFFDTYVEAQKILNSMQAILCCHEHLKRIDKSRFSLEKFLKDLRFIIREVLK